MTRHVIANEQKRFRWSPEALGNKFVINERLSANFDDRTMLQVHLWPFANAVKAGTSAIMCAYTQINQHYGCANPDNLKYLLKNELGL
ncbi:MAG: hypothetical protein Q9180_009223 [Flavoplaca navasiana]